MDPVGALVTSIARTDPDVPVRDVAERFFGDPQLEALALVRGDRPCGLVTRSRLLLRLARGFGQELYARKPVARIAIATPLQVRAEEEVGAAVERALARLPDSVYDEVIVVDGEGRYLGLLSVRQLVLRQGLALARTRAAREAAEARATDLEALERLRAQLLAHTAHDLRSPANAVVGVAELMRRHAERGAWTQVAARLPLLLRAATTLRTTVNNVLDLSRLEAGRTEVELGPVELGPLLEDVAATARLLCGEKPIAVVLDVHGVPDALVSDGQKLRQMALNLASNAAKFTEAGRITIGAAVARGELRLWVDDTGIGIQEQDLARLFTPFGQLDDARDRRHEGSGLGLAITRSMAQLLGGRVEVASRHHQGSTFTVHLPVQLPGAGPAGAHREPSPMTRRRILVIDDDRTHLVTTQELLEDDGYEVLLQPSPFGATERIMVARPDLVLLDVNMPALSGEALLPLLRGREQTRDTLVVLYSSNDESALRAAAVRLGAAGYVCKGDLPGLRRTVARLAPPMAS